MLKSNFKFLVFAVFFALIIAALVFWQKTQPRAGEKIFNNIGDNIEINGLNFEKKDDLWQIKEFNNFYADVSLIENISYFLNNAKYLKEVEGGDNKFKKVLINKKKFFIDGCVVKVGSEKWLASYCLDLPKESYDYLLRPIFNINYYNVDSFVDDGIVRRFIASDVINKINDYVFIDAKKDIDETKIQEIQIIMASGLVVNITYYKNNWLSVYYSTTRIFKIGVKELADNYNFVTKDWYFKYKN